MLLCCYVQFLWSEFMKASKIDKRITDLCDSYCVSQRKVCGWVEIFREGWMNLIDFAYPWQSSAETCFIIKDSRSISISALIRIGELVSDQSW